MLVKVIRDGKMAVKFFIAESSYAEILKVPIINLKFVYALKDVDQTMRTNSIYEEVVESW